MSPFTCALQQESQADGLARKNSRQMLAHLGPRAEWCRRPLSWPAGGVSGSGNSHQSGTLARSFDGVGAADVVTGRRRVLRCCKTTSARPIATTAAEGARVFGSRARTCGFGEDKCLHTRVFNESRIAMMKRGCAHGFISCEATLHSRVVPSSGVDQALGPIFVHWLELPS